MNTSRFIMLMNHSHNVFILSIMLAVVSFSACTVDTISPPPTIKVFVNGDDVSSASTVHVVPGTRIEYRFEVTAFTTIADLKTVFFDIAIPTKKITKEVLVAGQSSLLNETVKGVVFASGDTEIMLIVKDIDGNEVAKSFTFIVD